MATASSPLHSPRAGAFVDAVSTFDPASSGKWVGDSPLSGSLRQGLAGPARPWETPAGGSGPYPRRAGPPRPRAGPPRGRRPGGGERDGAGRGGGGAAARDRPRTAHRRPGAARGHALEALGGPLPP